MLRLLRVGLLIIVPFVTLGALAGCEDDSTSPPTDMSAIPVDQQAPPPTD